jgi:hypothetical protein
MRILYVGDFAERENGALFFSTTSKLVNGFTRNGHHVQPFSDREIARGATPFRSKALGARAMNRRLLETVENFSPEMIVLAHADLLERDTLAAIRGRPEPPRIALRSLDPLFDAKTIRNVKRYEGFLDAIFITTAGEPLRQFSAPGCVVGFMPNPVCRAIDTGRAFENEAPAHRLFFAARFANDSSRADWCREIRRRLPDLVADFRGFDGRPSTFGMEYMRALGEARMGLSLDRGVFGHLYSSDRLAQYAGNGLATLIHRGTGYDTLFGEEEMIFFEDLDDLIAKIGRYAADDAAAREIARRGWARYHAIFDVDVVTRYIVEATFREPFSADYAWPTTLY